MVQWLRICPAMQGMQVQCLVRELISHVPWSKWALTPQLLSMFATTTESMHHREDWVPQLRTTQPNKYDATVCKTELHVILLKKEAKHKSSLSLCHVGTQQERSSVQGRKRALSRTLPCWYLILDLQPPKLWDNTSLLVKPPPPVYGTLLWQSELIHWIRKVISLCLCFLIFKMKAIIEPTQLSCSED